MIRAEVRESLTRRRVRRDNQFTGEN